MKINVDFKHDRKKNPDPPGTLLLAPTWEVGNFISISE